MDIIFNGPIKRFLRSARARAIYRYMKEWKLKASLTAGAKPVLAPPVPTMITGLDLMSAAMASLRLLVWASLQRGKASTPSTSPTTAANSGCLLHSGRLPRRSLAPATLTLSNS